MRAVVLKRGTGSPELVDWPEPAHAAGAGTLLETVEVGLCGTDALMLDGTEGEPPPGEDSLILGHEGLSRVLEPQAGSQLREGDLVVSAVRWPDPKPCEACHVGRADLCLNEGWTEHGIRGRHGFMVDRWVTDASRLVMVPPRLRRTAVLLEPLSVVVNMLERLGSAERARLGRGHLAVVVGAGTVGILTACVLALEDRKVVLADRLDPGSRRGGFAADLSFDYLQVKDLHEDAAFRSRLREADLVVEAAGAPSIVLPALALCRANGTVAVLGTGQGRVTAAVDTNEVASELVQHNKTLLGCVNASFAHLRTAVGMLERITERWPGRLEEMVDRYQPSELSTVLTTPLDRYLKSAIVFN